jgi:hypothetical protein
MSRDFDKSGNIKPGAPQTIIENVTAEQLDKHTHFDPVAWASVRKWMQIMREKMETCR